MKKKLELLTHNLYQLGYIPEAYMVSRLGLPKLGSNRGGHSRESLGATLPWERTVFGHWEWAPVDWFGYRYVIEDRHDDRFGVYAPGTPEKDFRVLMVFFSRDMFVEDIINNSPNIPTSLEDRVTRDLQSGFSILGEHDTFAKAADQVLKGASDVYIDILTDPNDQFNFSARRDYFSENLDWALLISIDRELENRGISFISDDSGAESLDEKGEGLD